ncbi:MAG: sensor histidine kinase [Bacteroidales bacterium]|nr:sensor histidine kinase [Bacteroidales bacterium]
MKTKYKILIHVAFWVYMFNQILLSVAMQSEKEYSPFGEITIYPVTSFITFYSFYFTYGLFFTKKKKIYPILLLVIVFSTLIPLRIGLEYLFWKYIGYNHMKGSHELIVNSVWWFSSLRLVIVYGIYALLIQLAIGWFDTQKLRTELMLEKQSGELALLRSQINPHFLFNTLNNIYSLVYKKSEDAPEAVMKMSAIMRYMLYDATTDNVLLEKEIEYLKSFIELEKLRLKHSDFVELNIMGNVEGRTIAPMLLIPFVENAFKHSNRNVSYPGIRINLSIGPQQILFEVTNHIRKNVTFTKDQVGGIGLNNIRRRLNLLYPGKHQLVIKSDEDQYLVKLTLST